jgi:hypothetical protein
VTTGTAHRRSHPKAFWFVIIVIVGVMSLSADMTYGDARGVKSQFLVSSGASALAVSAVAGPASWWATDSGFPIHQPATPGSMEEMCRLTSICA